MKVLVELRGVVVTLQDTEELQAQHDANREAATAAAALRRVLSATSSAFPRKFECKGPFWVELCGVPLINVFFCGVTKSQTPGKKGVPDVGSSCPSSTATKSPPWWA